jgi:SAM-dependent methyltransferase
MRNIALPASFESELEYFTQLIAFWTRYQHFCSFHLYDLYQQTILDQFLAEIDPSWRDFLMQNSCEQVIDSMVELMTGTFTGNRYPKDFLNWIERCNEICLPTTFKPEDFDNSVQNEEYSDLDCTGKGMGRKKYHEVSQLSQLIQSLVLEHRLDFIVDIGCGLGYLTHILADRIQQSWPDFHVFGVDGDRNIVKSAQYRTSKRNKNDKTKLKINFIEHKMSSDNAGELMTAITSQINAERADEQRMIRGGTIALHACGNLSSILSLNHLLDPAVQLIVTVGCCYQHLNPFPCSQYFSQRIDSFDKNILKIGTQTFEGFTPERLRSFWMRQTDYGRERALEPTETSEIIIKSLAFLSVIKNYMGQVIESIVLCDRYLDGKERGYECHLLPLFNRKLSPRSFVFIASKR